MLKFSRSPFFRHPINRFLVNRLLCKRYLHQDLVHTSLVSRSLIRVSGPDSHVFLQGLVTNDIQNLESQPSLFTVFLNQAGRILFDSIIYSTSTENTVLIECDTHVQQNLISHLKLYRIRRNVQVEEVTEVKPVVVWDPGHSDIPASLRRTVEVSITCKELPDHNKTLDFGPDVVAVSDPRANALGYRVLLPVQHKLEGQSKVKLQGSTEHDYRLLLYSLGVGEGFIDYPIGNSFPLESNVDYLNGVNFHKGCYIGQELTARTHHTGVVRKRLMPFRIPEGIKIAPEVDKSTLQLLNQSGRPVAKVRNLIDSYGLALVRLEEAFVATEIKLGDHLVHIEKPAWWPPSSSTVVNRLVDT